MALLHAPKQTAGRESEGNRARVPKVPRRQLVSQRSKSRRPVQYWLTWMRFPRFGLLFRPLLTWLLTLPPRKQGKERRMGQMRASSICVMEGMSNAGEIVPL
jgi:hypothetical protein